MSACELLLDQYASCNIDIILFLLWSSVTDANELEMDLFFAYYPMFYPYNKMSKIETCDLFHKHFLILEFLIRNHVFVIEESKSTYYNMTSYYIHLYSCK